MMSKRVMGKASFAHLRDDKGAGAWAEAEGMGPGGLALLQLGRRHRLELLYTAG